MPGVLPTINQQAVEYTIMTALALNCVIPEYTKFDRKNYPYPDLMKGYQISQYDAPLGHQGGLAIEVNGQRKKVGITRVHLEEDVAKLIHRTSSEGESYSLVDVNRAGVPLMEIVGEPDLRSPEEARQYLIKLRSILQYLGVSTGNMEEGSFRCDANISIRPENSPDSMAKVEVKNMNSFKAVYRALEYEVKRQRRAAEEGRRLFQETRGWVEEIKSKLPELPEARRNRFVANYNLSLYDANLLTSSKAMADYEEEFVAVATGTPANLPKAESAKLGSNWLLGEVSRIINAYNIDIVDFREKVSPERLVRLSVLNSQAVVNTATAKSMLGEMFNIGKDPDTIFEEGERGQISDTQEVKEVVSQVIEANARAVTDYKEGKTQSLTFLVGQVMKITRGRANPKLVNELLRKRLEER
jgi:aspartyl-tRNA(Asn)/glutamyl-tRNA(Gln) amidotransferase subunit B